LCAIFTLARNTRFSKWRITRGGEGVDIDVDIGGIRLPLFLTISLERVGLSTSNKHHIKVLDL
jgi:hypothetical protein